MRSQETFGLSPELHGLVPRPGAGVPCVQAALGRTFTPEESVPGSPRVAVLTWDLWERRFGGDPDVVGRAVSLQGEPHTVVGVMPRGFEFPWWSDIYLPLQVGVSGAGGESRNMRAVARLADGVTLEQARTVMEGVQGALRAHDPGRHGDQGVYLNHYQHEERAHQRQGLVFLLVGVVGNVRQISLDSEEAAPGFYLPYANAPQYGMTFLLKTEGEPTLLAGPAWDTPFSGACRPPSTGWSPGAPVSTWPRPGFCS